MSRQTMIFTDHKSFNEAVYYWISHGVGFEANYDTLTILFTGAF